jgi:hypothetical protein
MSIKVTAIIKGYYGLLIREPGDQFTIEDESEFSKKWMLRGHQGLSPDELMRLGRDSKRMTQAQVVQATSSAGAKSSTVRVSDKSPV